MKVGGVLVSFECTGEPDGVRLYFRGAVTMQVPFRHCPFAVVGRDPLAGEGP